MFLVLTMWYTKVVQVMNMKDEILHCIVELRPFVIIPKLSGYFHNFKVIVGTIKRFVVESHNGILVFFIPDGVDVFQKFLGK